MTFTYRTAPTPLEAAQEPTEWVYLDELPGRTLPGKMQPVYGYGTFDTAPIWWANGDDFYDNHHPLTVIDHRVEVIAPPPPGPVSVVVGDANDAHALIGRSIRGETVTHVGHDRELFTMYGVLHNALWTSGWGSSVLVDPLPVPEPPDEWMAVEFPRSLVEAVTKGENIDYGTVSDACVAALAAEGDTER